MNKLVLIFDYFKEAFHTNKQNKSLYKPQLALIALNLFLILLVGVGIYNWIGVENFNNLGLMEPSEIFAFFWNQGLKLAAIILSYILISVLVESGLLNMYKKAVTLGHTEGGDFGEGISKYFLKLLIGKLFILACYIIALPFYFILGIITLTVGLTVIPLVAGIFLTMWKISMVMNDSGIFAAIGDSFRFAKNNFIPLTVLQLIHWAFAAGPAGSSGGGGGGGNYNFPNSSSFNEGLADGYYSVPGIAEQLDTIVGIIKTVVAVIIPIIAIASVAASVIAMIFEVFFMLALFVAYKNGFKVEEKPIAMETEDTATSMEEEAQSELEESEVVEQSSKEVEQ